MSAEPVISYDDLLITAIASTQAPTSPLLISQSNNNQEQRRLYQQAHSSQRQHQVLIAGSSEGSMKRIVLLPDNNNLSLRGVEFDSVQIADKSEQQQQHNHHQQQQQQASEQHQEPILADLHLMPTINPQVSGGANVDSTSNQFAILATAHKAVKLRINSCKAQFNSNNKSQFNNRTTIEECHACAQLQDPFCGWCATSGSCMARDECLKTSMIPATTSNSVNHANWTPFDQIKCSDYQPISPQLVPIQSTNQNQLLDVNIKINIKNNQQQQVALLANQLAQTQFLCHFDYIALLTNRTQQLPNVSGAITKALQARLNLHTSTVIIACPMPVYSQRPITLKQDLIRVKLSVRLINNNNELATSSLQQLLGMKRLSSSVSSLTDNTQQPDHIDQVEREFYLYDCSQYTTCGSCLSSSNSPQKLQQTLSLNCQWCPLSNKCTFNASHPDLGCAASAIISTTPQSAIAASVVNPSSNHVRGSHLMNSLDQAQANVYATSFSHISQCPNLIMKQDSLSDSLSQMTAVSVMTTTPTTTQTAVAQDQQQQQQSKEILIPNNSRQSIRIALNSLRAINQVKSISSNKRVKYECLFDFDGAKMRLSAKLIEEDSLNIVVVCQEQLFSYQEEIATLRAQLNVIQINISNGVGDNNQNQQILIDTLDGEFLILICYSILLTSKKTN